MRSKDLILQMFKSSHELTVKEIMAKSRQTRQMIHHAIRQLIAAKKIVRVGHQPRTIYRLLPDPHASKSVSRLAQLSPADRDFLQTNFLVVDGSGELLEGHSGFEYYCHQRSLRVDETFAIYRNAPEFRGVARGFYGIIEGMFTLIGSIPDKNIRLDRLYFLNFEFIRGFGRSRLGTLLYFAKNGQNKTLMRKLMDSIGEPLRYYLNSEQPEAIAFIPPIIPREVQLMRLIETQLDVSLPLLEIQKTYGTVAVPQQSLFTVDERIRNAGNIFSISSRRKYKHVLLIDDAVASGATLNQIAEKIKVKGIAAKVTGLAIVSGTDDFRNQQPDKVISA